MTWPTSHTSIAPPIIEILKPSVMFLLHWVTWTENGRNNLLSSCHLVDLLCGGPPRQTLSLRRSAMLGLACFNWGIIENNRTVCSFESVIFKIWCRKLCLKIWKCLTFVLDYTLVLSHNLNCLWALTSETVPLLCDSVGYIVAIYNMYPHFYLHCMYSVVVKKWSWSY